MNAITMIEGDVLEAEQPVQHALTAQPQSAMTPAQAAHPDNLLAIALQKGVSLDQLERFMALKERHDANEARKAYTESMARAKRSPPTIGKDKFVSFLTQKGVTEYHHATLGNVVRNIVAWLAEYGFSHAWRTEQIEGGRVAVTCTLTHAMGHSESVTLDAFKDDSGGKNNIQSLGSSVTYLQRYTLLAITGLATEDQDDDGASSAAMGHQEPGQQGAPCDARPQFYPAEGFTKNLPSWTKLIEGGQKTAEQVIATVEKKAPLSDEQKAKLRAIKPAQ